MARLRSGKIAGYLLAAILGGLIGGFLGNVLAARTVGPVSVGPAFKEVVVAGEPPAAREGVVQVMKRLGPAVVNIDTVAREPGTFGFPFSEGSTLRQGEGSGFIINGREGLVVTNNHVLEGAQQITVTLPDKRSFRHAKVIGTDPVGDVALLKITGGARLPEVSFGDSDKLEIGQTVIAIGSPLGFQNTVTVGVLSQTGRQLEGRIQGLLLEDLLQTDAAINPGNSGGPLLDIMGRVIGMNTAMIPQAQGIGFAVAANTIKRSIADIRKHGRVIRPWIGVTMMALTPELARALGLPKTDLEAVVVRDVRRGEPAQKAGLEPGDVLTEANGQQVKSTQPMKNVIRDLRPGEKLSLKGFRKGSPKAWEVRVGEMPSVSEFGE